MAEKKAKLIVISAPSGTGKTTSVMCLLERNKNLVRSISYTTRPARPGEVDGKDYFFVSREEFQAKKKSGFFLESAEVFGQWYGTSREYVAGEIAKGKSVVLAIDVQGMKQLRAERDSGIPIISIFIVPPSMEILRKRLERRKTETKSEIDTRLEMAQEEMKSRSLYDFSIMNEEVDQTVRELERIIQ